MGSKAQSPADTRRDARTCANAHAHTPIPTPARAPAPTPSSRGAVARGHAPPPIRPARRRTARAEARIIGRIRRPACDRVGPPSAPALARTGPVLSLAVSGTLRPRQPARARPVSPFAEQPASPPPHTHAHTGLSSVVQSPVPAAAARTSTRPAAPGRSAGGRAMAGSL